MAMGIGLPPLLRACAVMRTRYLPLNGAHGPMMTV